MMSLGWLINYKLLYVDQSQIGSCYKTTSYSKLSIEDNPNRLGLQCQTITF